MDSSYIPAIITAIAGIAGIIINVSVNTWYRYRDIKEKRKEKNIIAYESFYAPFYNKLLILQCALSIMLNEFPEIKIKTIGEYLKNETAPAKMRTNIDDIYEAACSVNEFVSSQSFKYISDYKIKVYFDKIMKFVVAVCRAKDKHESFPEFEFDIEYIDKLLERIDYISINNYTSNFIYRLYLRRWENKQ